MFVLRGYSAAGISAPSSFNFVGSKAPSPAGAAGCS